MNIQTSFAKTKFFSLFLATSSLLLSSCKLNEVLTDSSGHYEGIAFITNSDKTVQHYAKGDISSDGKSSLMMTLQSAESDATVWDFELRIKDENHVVLSSHSGWINSIKLTRGQDDCFLTDKKSEITDVPRICFDGHELSIAVNLRPASNSITFILNRVESKQVPPLETPAVYSISDLMERAKNRSFETRIEFEKVVEARLNARVAMLNLLPHANVNTVLRLLSLNPFTMGQTIGEVAPFLLPNRWFHAATEKFQSHAEFYAWTIMRADSENITEGLAYEVARDSRQIQRLEDRLDAVTQIRDDIRHQEDAGLIAVGSSDSITSVMYSIQAALAQADQLLKDEIHALSQAVGFYNPEAVIDVSGIKILPVNALPSTAEKDYSELALAKSLELRQMDGLISSAKSAVGERVFNWLDPTGDPSGSLGLGFPAYIKIGVTEENLLKVKRQQLQSIVLRRTADAVTEVNEASSLYATAELNGDTVTQALSEYLPHVYVKAKFDETTLPNPTVDITDFVGTPEPYGVVVVSARQTLFDFGRALSQIEANRAESHSAEQQAYAVKNTVELAVDRSFYGVLEAEKLVEVTTEGFKQFEETYRRTQILVKTGTRPAFDLTQAEVEYSRAKLELINAKTSFDLSKITLLNLMGESKQIAFKLRDVPRTDLVTSEELNLARLTREALEHRPEMKGHEFGLEAARYSMQAEVRTYFPRLDLEGWYGDYLPNYPARLQNAWGAGLSMTWPIFEGLKTSARVGELSARMGEREAKLEKERERIVAQVAAGYMSLVRAESNLQVANEALKSASLNSLYARKRYTANVATILELLVAETSRVNADSAAVDARYRHSLAISNLERVVNAPLRGK